MTKKEDTYNEGAELTFALMKRWFSRLAPGEEAPRFAFPPKEIALLADLRDIGKRLARNGPAQRLVDHLIDQVVFATGQAPTAMMLRVMLEELGQPIEWVSCSELGLKVPQS